MKKLYSTFLIVILLSPIFFTVISAEDIVNISEIISSKSYDKGYRYNIQGWIYLHIEGEPYDRGYQHGYLLSNEIIDMLNRWSNIIHNQKHISKISKKVSDFRYKKISEAWWNFCRNQCYRIYWNKFPDEYKQEIKGIADGVNAKGVKLHLRPIDYKDILAMNEMFEFMTKFTTLRMGIHPFRTLLHYLKRVEPELSSMSIMNIINDFLSDDPPHHCNGFIATGDATTRGQIVFSHSTIGGGGAHWWWNYYISLRWNLILDVQPSKGNRIIMSSCPGFIWSDEDYYQNDNGILLLETTVPQGLFDNIGLPLTVRARMAIQYGNSIDDVVYYLRYKNDGAMNAVWLIGDTKTGEIARFDLGYSAHALYRTYNGFYWSANNPLDLRVRMERFKIDRTYLLNLIMWILKKNPSVGYYSIRYIPTKRDLKFEELGDKYYGQIDTNIVKEIMSDPIISKVITDVKITDTKLLEQNGLWAFYGNTGKAINYTNIDTTKRKTESLHPNGWVRIFGIPSKRDFSLTTQKRYIGTETEVIWKFNTGFNINEFATSGVVKNNILYATTSVGMIYALDTNNGNLIWKKYVGEKPTKPIIHEDLIIVGYSEGLSILDIHGTIKRISTADEVVSSPIINNNLIIFGDNGGRVYAFTIDKKKEKWSIEFSDEIYLASAYDYNIYLTSGKNCYALSLSNQKISWQFNSSGMITSAPVLKNGILYFTSWDNYIYALNANNGKLIWKYETGWGSDTSPVLSGELIYIGSNDNNLYALNAKDGRSVWVFTCKGAIHSSPVVYGDFVFFGSDDGRLYAVNKTTGEGEWFFAANLTIDDDLLNYITTPIVSNPVVDNGTAYIGANGIIYALDAKTFDQSVLKNEKKNIEIPLEALVFIILSLLVIIIVTMLYIFLIKKRFK